MDARGGPDRPRGSASQGGALTAPASDRRTYPPSARLKRRGEYLSVQTAGRKLYSKHFVILVREGESTESRLGVTISRKVDKRATRRNSVRRRLREIFRNFRHQLVRSLDIVIIARAGAVECSMSQVRKEILGALRYHQLLNPA